MQHRLKNLREMLGLSQRAFADKIKASQQAIWVWENGRGKIPPAQITQICEVFGVRREWLEFGRGEMSGKDAPINAKPTLRDCVKVLFEALRPEAQQAVLDAFKDYQKAQQKTQINNGVINGNMTQN